MTPNIIFNDKPLGHIIEGIDVKNLSDAAFAVVDSAYAKYGVIVIRDQALSPEDQISFSRRFGNLVVYPMEEYRQVAHPEIFVVSNIIENGKPIGMKEAGSDWHTDMASTPSPPRGSILYAIEVPTGEDGKPLGDTLFASSRAAYDALPADMKLRLEGKFGIFGVKAAANDVGEAGMVDLEKSRKIERQRDFFKPVAHPIIRAHPITGHKTLYISPNGMLGIEGASAEESAELIEFLSKHITNPEFVYRHSWKVGDIVLWDNCNVIHKAIQDYSLPLRRKMYRTTIEGWPTH